ncbi:unnamed protein product [Vicia faba]|uniref:TITAN-like protein n=1 Tax=Vicia faba TaxID=3906 RepID=A0AAV0ZVK8_VICFA|nr:unnamed protein product [Vicia faba]
MREQSENRSAKPGTKEKKKSEFEFCKVCNINYDQGIRHKYFPKHKKSLSTFLSRFQNKLSDVRYFLKTPTSLSPQLASRNRFWCVFCDQDINELVTSFACENAIRHLASVEHVNNLKHFFWKYGGAMDQLDVFKVSDNDIAKWEKRCTALKKEASLLSEGSPGAVFRPSSGMSISANPLALQDFAVGRSGYSLPCNGGQWSSDGYTSNKVQLLDNGKGVNGESSQQGIQMLTRISIGPAENNGGNVHSGAPPPWFETTEVVQILSKPVSRQFVSHSNKSGKHKKLNPKRVGAAWAEKRKIEMEMEKRGEIVRNECDANWLPNFGRVWQSGSRRESRKEFEKEKQKLLNVETQSEMPIKIQPYVSKRMRMDSGADHASG